MKNKLIATIATAALLVACQPQGQQEKSDPLPSWGESAARTSILEFVAAVTNETGPDYVPPEERIAVFDNDGTLWAEQPIYFQLMYTAAVTKEVLEAKPELATEEPFATFVNEGFAGLDTPGLLRLILAVHTGMSNTEYKQSVGDWLKSSTHPVSGRPYTEMVYQPMLELLDYLRTNNFDTYIVSGGGLDFLRVFAEDVYGIPPEQVVGSFVPIAYQETEDGPILARQAKPGFINDGPGKPVGIERSIGRRPIFAFGNSDGDHEMLLWTMAGEGPRFAGFVWHTDEEREWAYDRDSSIGHFDKALDDAQAKGWTLVDMKNDWRVVFAE